MQKIPVILDTDIGTDIDDTWALVMLLNCPELDPRLITTVGGDTAYRAHLAAKLLQVAGRTDIPIGVGLGQPEGGLNFQAAWLDDFNLATYPGTIHADGVAAMLDVIAQADAPVTLISIGVASNIARALALAPEIAPKCRFVGMYGSIDYGYDGAPGAVAEANVRYDIPAFQQVLAAPWRELVLTPLDTCGLVRLAGGRYQQVFRSLKPLLKALIENYKVWAKAVTWLQVSDAHLRSSTLFDTVAVYLSYSSSLLELLPLRIRVTADGLTLPDPDGAAVQAALRWRDLDGFLDHLLARLGM